jgi:hypothetical protein
MKKSHALPLLAAEVAALISVSCASAANPQAPAKILVGITGYGDSREFGEVVTNAECNLYVQWGRAANLTPCKSPIMDDAMFALANRRSKRSSSSTESRSSSAAPSARDGST